MKNLILLLAILMPTSLSFGQKKSEVNSKDTQIKTLIQEKKYFTEQLDSVSKNMVKYIGVYNTIKEKVSYSNFDPTRAAYLIDSLRTLRDSTSALLYTIPVFTTSTYSI